MIWLNCSVVNKAHVGKLQGKDTLMELNNVMVSSTIITNSRYAAYDKTPFTKLYLALLFLICII